MRRIIASNRNIGKIGFLPSEVLKKENLSYFQCSVNSLQKDEYLKKNVHKQNICLGVSATQLDLKEAGSVVKPNRKGANVVEGLGPTVPAREKAKDVYILYEEAEEEEWEEEEEGGGAKNKEGTVNRNALSPPSIRRKSTVVGALPDDECMIEVLIDGGDKRENVSVGGKREQGVVMGEVREKG